MTLDFNDKCLLLLHYERILMKKGKVYPEYETVASLCNAFGVNKNTSSKGRFR